jgi:DNA end-binding protein Ku
LIAVVGIRLARSRDRSEGANDLHTESASMAAIWKGAISFGLVNIPVELRTAVRPDHVSFRLLHAKDLVPVKYERVCEADGKAVPWSEIVKGYEYRRGHYVVLTDDDFKAAALESSKAIDIADFVKSEEIDPRFFDTPYYLVPAKGGEKSYALLREAMRAMNAVGIGKLTMRQKQSLAAIKVVGDALVLETMRFANELVDTSEYNFPPASGVRPQELKMAEQLVANLAEPFNPAKYTDDYRANLMKIIKAKMKGKKVAFEEADEPEKTRVIDLMARLKASLEQAGKRGGAAPTGASGGARKAAKAVASRSKRAARARPRETA